MQKASRELWACRWKWAGGKIRQMSNLAADESHIDLLHFFKALADETRLKMAALLTSKPRSGEQLAELLSIKPATVSHHLSKLADAGLVISTSEGHKKFYRLRLEAVRATAHQLQSKDPGLLVSEERQYYQVLPEPCSLRRVRSQGAQGLF